MSSTISALPAAPNSLDGAEIVPIVQGPATVRTTVAAVAEFTLTQASSDPTFVEAISDATIAQALADPAFMEAVGDSTLVQALADPAFMEAVGDSTITQALNDNTFLTEVSNFTLVAAASSSAFLNSILPDQTGESGNFLTTDGSNVSWAPAGSNVTNVVVLGSVGEQSPVSGTDARTLVFSIPVEGGLPAAGGFIRFTVLLFMFNFSGTNQDVTLSFGISGNVVDCVPIVDWPNGAPALARLEVEVTYLEGSPGGSIRAALCRQLPYSGSPADVTWLSGSLEETVTYANGFPAVSFASNYTLEAYITFSAANVDLGCIPVRASAEYVAPVA